MSTNALSAPPGFLRLREARDRLIESGAFAARTVKVGPHERTWDTTSAAIEMREAIFEGKLDLFAWPPDGSLPRKLLGRVFETVVQPNDGTVLTAIYLGRSPHAVCDLPGDMLNWLPTAELLLDETQFMRWIRVKKPQMMAGAPSRDDAIAAARRLVSEGRWNPMKDRLGDLHQLLHQPGVLKEKTSLSTSRRIAIHLGYRSRRKPPSRQEG